MTGPEAKLTKQVIAWLRARPGTWTVKVAAGPWQSKGLPDVLHLEGGRLFALELKAPKGKVTPLQAATLLRLRAAGAVTEVVRSMEDLTGLFSLFPRS